MSDAGSRIVKYSRWRGVLTVYLLGIACGLAIDLLDGATLHPAIAASLTLPATLLTFSTYPRTPAFRAPALLPNAMLALSLVATLVAAVVAFTGPPYLTPYPTFGAVGSTSAVVVVLAAPADRLALSAATATIGLGTSLIGAGVGWLINLESPYAIMVISIGLGAIGVGAAWLTHRSRPGGTAMLGLGIATWTWSNMNIEVWSKPWITSIGLGIGLFGFGGAWQQWQPQQHSEPYLGLTAIILGVAMIAFGAVLLPYQQALLIGLEAVGSGAAAIGLGTVLLTRDPSPGAG